MLLSFGVQYRHAPLNQFPDKFFARQCHIKVLYLISNYPENRPMRVEQMKVCSIWNFFRKTIEKLDYKGNQHISK